MRAMKSTTLPPCLHSLKQFQRFLLRLTRNCVGFVPLWMGQQPLRLSSLRFIVRQQAVMVEDGFHRDGLADRPEVDQLVLRGHGTPGDGIVGERVEPPARAGVHLQSGILSRQARAPPWPAEPRHRSRELAKSRLHPALPEGSIR